MPYKDKTGPEGKGPRTGKGLGLCDIDDTTDDKVKSTPEKVIKNILG